MKKLYSILLAALFSASVINAQNTIFTENFGGNYTHLESLSNNSSGYNHTGTGDFTHKIVSGQGASGSKCFGQLDSSGVSSVSRDLQLFAGNTYEFKAYVKTIQSMSNVTLRIKVNGLDVATSGNTSANGAWEELSCTYTPSGDDMASLMFVKTGGQLANIDKIKVICTSCPDQNYVFDFNDSKESWNSGGGSALSLGNDAMNIKATGSAAVARSGNLTADLNLNASNYDRARVTFRTPYAAGGAGAGKLYFYNLAAGNAQFAVFDLPRDLSNTTTFQTVEIDLTSTPTSGNFSGPIARLGFRAPWGITSGDTCFIQKIELYNTLALTLTGIMDFTVPTGGSTGKAIQLTANQNISDLSIYSLNTFSNGSTSGGTPYTFPSISINAGEHVLLCRDSTALAAYFGSCWNTFHHIVQGSQPTGNGDDATVLYMNNNIVETHGVVGVDGTGQPWEYLDSWAWKDTAVSNVGNWVYGAVNCTDGSSSNATSNCPYPLCNVSPPSSYNVTLKVNTANITVGANGMYAGGGFLGGSDGLLLTDTDGDGTWEGVASVNIGSGPNYYAFFNSPNSSSDWGTKEDLTGTTCGISTNYNDRLLPTITSDTTILHCFGNCAFDGTCTAPVSTTYDLTLSVNTANITVGANGMYAGGGVLGDAMAVQLFDADGDGTWTGTATINAGATGNYIFLNSPSNGGDWGTKEDLTGLACSDPANYNDRILPNITSDTTMLHCFGSCETDGTCPATVAYDLTLSVNTANITVGANGMYAGGGVLGDAMAVQLFDADGDGTWTGTATINAGATGNYIFLNSPSNGGDWGTKEDLTGLACSDPANYNDRILPNITSDTTMLHCFGSCETDGTCPATGVNITFQVDMSQVSDTFNIPELNATFNNWCGNCNSMSDANNDSVWDVVVSLTPGDTIEYKYSADSWTIQEMNDPGASCTNGDSTYTNRVLVVPASDTILGVVCWASCDPCLNVPPTGIRDWIDNVTIYPNPAKNILNISSSEIIQKVEVLDIVGRKVISKSLNSFNYQLDVSNLNSNVYFINYTIKGVITAKKVIVNN